MSVPAAQNLQLPAHLQNFGSAANMGLNAVSGINTGKSHPRISIKQNRFRTVDEQGQEFVIPQLHLDVIVVGVNPSVSKIYYAGAYNPQAAEFEAPTCFSDNGSAPSSRAGTPQAQTCAACPHNVWGSKLTPAGTKIKACSDSKKFAVILADNPTGLVYELRVPGASLENVKAIVDMLNERKVPLPGIVLRLTFDEKTDYPKLVFTPLTYISEAQKAAVLEVLDGEEVKEAVGLDDKPRTEALTAPAPQAALPPTPQPVAAAPLPPAPAPLPQFQPGIPAAQAAPPPVRRRRRAPAPDAAQAAAAPLPPQMQMPPAPATAAPVAPPPPVAINPPSGGGLEIPDFLKRPDVANAVPAAAAVQAQPQLTDAALDALLGDAMKP